MINWLQQIQSVLAKKGGDGKSGGLSDMLAPGALGGLAGLLVASKSSRKLLTKYGGTALLVGGGAAAGAVLWNKYKQRVRETHQDEPAFGQLQTPLDQRAERLVTALVFAAKSDGHIDDRERTAIEQNIHQAGYGAQAEALELYFLSCAAIDVDHFMERSYLSALGDALKIPQDVRDGIQRDIAAEKAV